MDDTADMGECSEDRDGGAEQRGQDGDSGDQDSDHAAQECKGVHAASDRDCGVPRWVSGSHSPPQPNKQTGKHRQHDDPEYALRRERNNAAVRRCRDKNKQYDRDREQLLTRLHQGKKTHDLSHSRKHSPVF